MSESEQSEWVSAVEGSLTDLKELSGLCADAGIPAELGMEPCAKPGCAPKARLLVEKQNLSTLSALLRDRWMKVVDAEGLQPVVTQASEEGELPCPACGTAAPLVEGACSDCGLQLE